ncbi:MAG: c-type cytochrome biogenesis protein CcmI [Pseudomonadota bacterium]
MSGYRHSPTAAVAIAPQWRTGATCLCLAIAAERRGTYLLAMLMFFITAGLIAAITLLVVLRPLVGRARVAAETRDAADAALYRDQLAEVDRDSARGVISAAEAEGARAEIARRLIAAAKRAEASDKEASDNEASDTGGPVEASRAPAQLTQRLAVGALLAVPALTLGLYLVEGAPGVTDRPLAERDLVAEARAARPTQEEAEAAALAARIDGPRRPAGGADYAELVTRLEEAVASRPDDIRGHRLLAGALMNQQRFTEAWPVFERLIALEGATAPAILYASAAEAMVLAANGYVSPRAEDAIAAALERDAALPVARYYAGLALLQAGRTEQGLTLWARLEREAPPDAPWLPHVRGVLAEAGAGSGVAAGTGAPGAPGVLPEPPLLGLDSEAVAAVQAMSPEERQAFMESRIDGLAERLREEGGGPDEWARLLTAYVTLGDREKARATYDASQQALEGAEAGFVRERALVLGVVEE